MFKNKWILALMGVLALISVAAIPHGIGHMTDLWIGSRTATPDVTPGDNDLYVNGTFEVDGAARFDSTVDINSTISYSNIVYFPLQLVAAFIDGTGVIGNDGSTAPGVAETDNIPAIVYANSGETTKIQWTFRLPPDYSSGLGFRMLISSGDASGAKQSIDWQIWENGNLSFDASVMAQTAVAATSATLDASCEELTFTIDATGETALAAGDWVTVDFWNSGSSDSTTEIKGLMGYYTSSQL